MVYVPVIACLQQTIWNHNLSCFRNNKVLPSKMAGRVIFSFYRGVLYSLEEGKNEHVRKNKGPSVQEKDDLESKGVDFAASIAFIIAFGLFNFFYWFILIL